MLQHVSSLELRRKVSLSSVHSIVCFKINCDYSPIFQNCYFLEVDHGLRSLGRFFFTAPISSMLRLFNTLVSHSSLIFSAVLEISLPSPSSIWSIQWRVLLCYLLFGNFMFGYLLALNAVTLF